MRFWLQLSQPSKVTCPLPVLPGVFDAYIISYRKAWVLAVAQGKTSCLYFRWPPTEPAGEEKIPFKVELTPLRTIAKWASAGEAERVTDCRRKRGWKTLMEAERVERWEWETGL